MEQNNAIFSINDAFKTLNGLKDITGNEPLAGFDYEKELEMKNNALAVFWKKNELPGIPEKIISSPKPRYYRTTSKRKVGHSDNKFILMINPKVKEPVEISAIEPEEHALIFKKCGELLNKSSYRLLALNANFVIIRGNYEEFSVILNLIKANSRIVNKTRYFSEELMATGVKIASFFIYIDPTGSKYYFESKIPEDSSRIQFKKIYGKDNLNVKYGNVKYFYHPVSFSQINQSIIGTMLENVKDMFCKGDRLIDLYCGYGLFSYYLADLFKETYGIDAEGESISSARESLRHKKTKAKMKFIPENINAHSLVKILPPVNMNEFIILDPPKQGTKDGVIRTLATRHPEKILYLFCGIDSIPKENSQYMKYGYEAKRIIPFDFFPGTPNFEIMILFQKK